MTDGTSILRVLVTCPPMLGVAAELMPGLGDHGVQLTCPPVVQVLSEQELLALVPDHDGWIIGDDPATEQVFAAGRAGRLRAAVKWGVGVDNVDLAAARAVGIPVVNTPGMFGRDVADVAMGYVIALARHTFEIDRGVRAGDWPKPRGVSLHGKCAGLVGYGDIGRQTALRLAVSGMRIVAYDPALQQADAATGMEVARWPERLGECDFLVFTCALNRDNRHMLNAATLARCKPGVRLVNVSRGALIDETALVHAFSTGRVHSAALDVMETEPFPIRSPLRGQRCIFGSHNASNTEEAVRATSARALELLLGMLKGAGA